MIEAAAFAWGRLIGRYGRRVTQGDQVRLAFASWLPQTPVIWVGWHELNLVTVALHGVIRSRPALAFIPTGIAGAAVRGWIGEFGIVPVAVAGGALDGLALRRMREGLKNGSDVIIAVDGPAGPRRRVRPGALWLAAAAGVPIMPIGCAARPAFRVPRWDRHLVPLPGAAIAAAIGTPITHGLEPKSRAAAERLAAALDGLMERAAAMLDSPDAGEAARPPERLAE